MLKADADLATSRRLGIQMQADPIFKGRPFRRLIGIREQVARLTD